MDTAQKLQSIEPTDFETLATSYLRNTKPEMRGLIHTGVNDKGASIKCPVDGVLFIHGDPTYCVQVAYTKTESDSDLRRKWLGGKKAKGKPEIGDIAKAHGEFELWRNSRPTAKHRLYLATNKFLANDTGLYREVIARAAILDIEVEIIEGSLLLNFLDNDPEGQYLRQELFGIEANRLSESLLKKIAWQSLGAHRAYFQFGSSDQCEIARAAQPELIEAISSARQPLISLTGSSGSGKSTLLKQCGERLNRDGGVCLWVPLDLLAQGISPVSLLDGVLRRFHPALNERAGEDALTLASQLRGGVTLLVDDINRVGSPAVAFDTLRALGKQIINEQSGLSNRTPRLKFVFPRWPSLDVSHSQSKEHEQEDLVNVELDFFSAQERATLANTFPGTTASQLMPSIDALSGDPFLCGLLRSCAHSRRLHTSINRAELINNVYEKFLEKAAKDTVRQSQATPGEVIEALDELIALIIEADDPEPAWRAIVTRVGYEKSRLLLDLSQTNRLGWVETSGAQEGWRWKHERLRDALVGRWLARHIFPDLLDGHNSERHQTALTTPGLAEAWALALVFVERRHRQAALALLGERQPLALAEALRLDLFRADAVARRSVAGELRRHLENYELKPDDFVAEPRWLLLRRIVEIDDDDVLVVTEAMEQNLWVNMARFRNGDVEAGLRVIKRESEGVSFLPWADDPLFEKAVERFAVRYQSQHDQLRLVLENAATDAKDIKAILILLGYLAWPDVASLAWQIWNRLAEPEQLEALAHLVWALARCAEASAQDKLEAGLLRVREISDEEKIEGNVDRGSERHWNFIEPLRCLSRWKISPASVKTIVDLAKTQTDLRETLLYILRHIDQPVAIESYIRILEGKGSLITDAFEPVGPHSISKGRNAFDCIPEEDDTRERLWQIIEEESNEDIRRMAFRFWSQNVSLKDLERLRLIKNADLLFDRALKCRLSLCDAEAAGEVIEKLQTDDPAKWILSAAKLYGNPKVAEAIFSSFDHALTNSPFNMYTRQLPLHLPPDGVRRLLKEHRAAFEKNPRSWTSLWRTELPEAFEFIQLSLKHRSQKGSDHFSRYADRNPYPVSQAMLDAIEPLLDRFSVEEKRHLARLAVYSGFADWAKAHSLQRVGMKGEPIHLWLTETEAIEALNQAVAAVPNGKVAVRETNHFYDLENRRHLTFDLSSLLRRWAGSQPPLPRLTIAGMILANVGTGHDADWWRACQPTLQTHEYEMWSRAFYFLRRRRWQRSILRMTN